MKSQLLRPQPLAAAIATLIVSASLVTDSISARSSEAGDGSINLSHNATYFATNGLRKTTGRYIVRFTEESVPAHFANLATTNKDKSSKYLDMNNPEVASYMQTLDQLQTQHLSDIATALGRIPTVISTMKHALNAVVLEGLSRTDVKKLAKVPGVISVQPDWIRHLTTDIGPGFIGASSVWWGMHAGQDTFFANGFDNAGGYRGDGVVIGDLDTGYNSLSPSFAATDDHGYTITNPLGNGTYLGGCLTNPTEINKAQGCNAKVIGVYQKVQGKASAEDAIGHGSHTASTLGGDSRSANLSGYNAHISGVAPHANLIIYGVCDADGCTDTATTQAADQAIQDKMNPKVNLKALNFSISGGTDPWNDATSLAFLNATNAGIFVAAAGGNSEVYVPNPIPGTVNHSEPWVTTVAAGTHTGGAVTNSLNITGPATPPSVALFSNFSGTMYSGFPQAIPNSPMVLSPNFENSDTMGMDGCAAYPANQFQGAIAVISRGTCNFSMKATNVIAAGAVAIVVSDNRSEDVSQTGFSLAATPVNVPMFSVSQTDGTTLQNYLNANMGIVAQIPSAAQRAITTPDVLADFSLLGPGIVDVIKPDVQAPGVSILAAIANDGSMNGPNLVALYDGTSMATPHTTGAGALLLGMHPDWTPMEAKSALMMTAQEADLTTYTPFCLFFCPAPSNALDRGSGRIQVDMASKAGLVLDEIGANFTNANPAKIGKPGYVNPTALNLASMQNSNCTTVVQNSTMTCSFTRTFTSTQDHTVTWTPVFYSDAGITTTMPATLVVGAKPSSQPLQINVSAITHGADSTFHYGELVLTPDDHNLAPLHLPIAVQVPLPTISTNTNSPIVSKAPLSAPVPSTLLVNIPHGNTQGNQSLAVQNIGGGTLNISNTNSTGGVEHAGYVVADQPLPQAASIGAFSDYWPDINVGAGPDPNGHAGSYAADLFAITGAGNLSLITLQGYFVKGYSGGEPIPGDLFADAQGAVIHFQIYKDQSGQPMGNPEVFAPNAMTPTGSVWNFDATIGTTPGLAVGFGNGLTSGYIQLDVIAAGAPPTNLPAGTYWLTTYVETNAGATMGGLPQGQAPQGWAWFESNTDIGSFSPGGLEAAVNIDPDGILGGNGQWNNNDDSSAAPYEGGLQGMAMHIEEYAVCGAPWLSTNPPNLSLDGLLSSNVTVTVDNTKFPQGQSSPAAFLCLDSNDSTHPVYAIVVQAIQQ